jgi:DNA modification methylase
VVTDVKNIRAIITSPPYKDRDGYSERLIREWAKSLWKMEYSGTVWLNFADLTNYPWRAWDTARLFTNEADMYLIQTIIWYKNHYRPRQGHRTLNSTHEYLFYIHGDFDELPILDRTAACVGVPYKDKSNIGRYSDRDVRCPGTVWEIPYETVQNADERWHPYQFPLALPKRCIALLNLPKSSIILDCFAGSGTTAVAASELGYPSIMIESNKYYVDILVERLGGNAEVFDVRTVP